MNQRMITMMMRARIRKKKKEIELKKENNRSVCGGHAT